MFIILTIIFYYYFNIIVDMQYKKVQKLLPCILFKKIYILALETASPGNQHCANCVGTLSFRLADVMKCSNNALIYRRLSLLLCRHTRESISSHTSASKKGKGCPYSITERRVPELIPVLGSQPAGDVSHKHGSRLPLLSARPVVTPATLKRAATNFAAW